MKITASQLRRIIKEEVQKVIAENVSLDFVPVMDSELMDSAEHDDDPAFAKANLMKIARYAAKLLGKHVSEVLYAWDENDGEGFEPEGPGQPLAMKNSSGEPWNLVATLGSLDGEPVVHINDEDSGVPYFLK